MYNINLNENEIIIYNNDEDHILSGDELIDVSVVVTNSRLIILQDGNKLGDMNHLLRTTKAIGFIPSKEIIFETPLCSIVDIINEKYIKVILNDNYFIEISDKNIINILKNNLKK